MATASLRPIEILLVEDNPGDVDLVLESLRDAKVVNELHVVTDGVDAIEYLRKQGAHADAVRPDLILLDLNLPKKDGREVLAEIKNDPDLKQIPVVVLTSSDSEKDVLESYRVHANCYIRKPTEFGRFLEVVQAIDSFWLTIVKLPSR
ncbi:MAG: response regulator [Deltaproteobacteria bacterium]|nr:response regulator [Deltaproteobacteria bacterium]